MTLAVGGVDGMAIRAKNSSNHIPVIHLVELIDSFGILTAWEARELRGILTALAALQYFGKAVKAINSG